MQNLVINGKNMSYGKVFQALNFTWRQSETIALMGPNGSGKSTLSRLIAGLIEPTAGDIYITDGGVPKETALNGDWRAVGLVGQHPRRQSIGASVAEELSFGLINRGLSSHQVKCRVREIIQAIGLEGKENQSPATLSGGERQRLVVAAVLAMKPQFVIFDEALSMLDIRSQERILQLLANMGKAAGKLWITHDPELARSAERLWLLQDGQLWDVGKPANVLANAELALKLHIPTRPDAAGARRRRKEIMMGSEAKGPKLQWDNALVEKRLRVNKAVEAGAFIGIVGASGSGKSTLLESAIGLIAPSEGSVKIEGVRLERKSKATLSRKIRILLQEAGEYLLDRTVRQAIFWGEKETDLDMERQYLERLHIVPELLPRSPETLSGGERQKVALATTLRTEPEILLLDEPMLGLDALGREAVTRVIDELNPGVTVLYVTHDLREVLPYANRIWLVAKGEVVRDCSAEDWFRYEEDFRRAGVRIPLDKPQVGSL